MNSVAAAVGAALLLGGASGCLLYTDPINSPPGVEIVADSEVWRGKPATFMARTRDDDQDPLTVRVEWARSAGRCPARPSADGLPPGSTITGRSFSITSLTTDPFCVWALATDAQEATAVTNLDAMARNRPPVGRISVDEPVRVGAAYELYSDFRLSASGSSDEEGDPLELSWSLTAPPASSAVLEPCAARPGSACRGFHAGTPGIYEVLLKVSDGADEGSPSIASLLVDDDRPPCVEATSPGLDALVLSPETTEDRVFYVTRVRDDGDPFPRGPRGQTSFVWFVDYGDGTLVRQLDADRPMLTIQRGTFRLGQTVRVRVEARDREWQRRPLTCADGAPLCGTREGCPERVTWTLRYR